MPRGIDYIDPERLERLKNNMAEMLSVSLNVNKNFALVSQFIFERTGAMVSTSTLRRVFQYHTSGKPTRATLDLICKSMGFADWNDFVIKEQIRLRFRLSQVISFLRMNGISDRKLVKRLIHENKDNQNIFALLDAAIQIAISKRDTSFLKDFFEMLPTFESQKDLSMMYFMIHNLMIGLKQAGIMQELLPFYGADPIAQLYLVEWYVDEDNLDGYYYELLQTYHRHKKTPQSLLFYYCLMYQHALTNNLSTQVWADIIRNMAVPVNIHHIPKARRLAVLLIEAADQPTELVDTLKQAHEFLTTLDTDKKTVSALFISRLLFKKRLHGIISEILSMVPDTQYIGKDIFEQIHINQLNIYKAYSLCCNGKTEAAEVLLSTFDTLYVDSFIQNSILQDFAQVSALIAEKKQLTLG